MRFPVPRRRRCPRGGGRRRRRPARRLGARRRGGRRGERARPRGAGHRHAALPALMRAAILAIALLACGGSSERRTTGRTELVYEIDLAMALIERAEVFQRDIEARLADSKILGVVRVSMKPGEFAVLLP